jgi:uncharacterized delta-60 repeat protein
MELQRLTRDGAVDAGFHPLIDNWYGQDSRIHEDNTSVPVLTIDSSDRIYAAVGAKIFRVLPDGNFDASYGREGWIYSSMTVVTMSIDRAGRLLIGGTAAEYQNGENAFYASMARILPTGYRDATFGDNGIVRASGFQDPGLTYEWSGEGPNIIKGQRDDIYIKQIVEDSQGRLVALRRHVMTDDSKTPTAYSNSYVIMRFRADGSSDKTFPLVRGRTSFYSDSSFGLGTSHAPEFADGQFSVYDIIVDSSDRILVGLVDTYIDEDWSGVLRLNPNGTRDANYGNNGFFDDWGVSQHPVIDRMQLLPGGQLLLVGHHYYRAQYRVTDDGKIDTSFGTGGEIKVAPQTQVAQILQSPDGSIIFRQGYFNLPDEQGEVITRHWLGEGPTATLRVRSINATTTQSQLLDVTYRDDGSLNLATLDNRDLRITGPKGFFTYAKFDKVLAKSNNNGVVTARYQMTAPGRTWDIVDNGAYSVQLRSTQVLDNDDDPAFARILGTFNVQIAAVAQGRSVVAFNRTVDRDELDQLTGQLSVLV